MRVIFLDVDGVLNANRPVGEDHQFVLKNWVLPHTVRHVNRIAAETGAVVCVSSTWRIGRELEDLKLDFAGVGLAAEIVGKTASGPCSWHPGLECSQGHRGAEIAHWLAEHPEVESYVILDDSSDMGPLLDRLVRTAWYKGLIRREVGKAVGILLGKRAGTGEGDRTLMGVSPTDFESVA